MDDLEEHLAPRTRCTALLAERGWRQIAVTIEGSGEIAHAYHRPLGQICPVPLVVQFAHNASDRLLRARREIQTDPHFVGVITVLTRPIPDSITHALQADELMSKDGRAMLLSMVEQLEAQAEARGVPHRGSV